MSTYKASLKTVNMQYKQGHSPWWAVTRTGHIAHAWHQICLVPVSDHCKEISSVCAVVSDQILLQSVR